MAKQKVSVTLSPERLQRARTVTGNSSDGGWSAIIVHPETPTCPARSRSTSLRSLGRMNASLPHRGEVWWADVPGDKVRPELVLTRERFITRLHSVVVAPVTTCVRVLPTEVPLTEEDGLPRACTVNFDNVFTLRHERLREQICALPAGKLDQVWQAYRFALGC